ncbi:2Fe-2S iron-sulfur cluster-binding protein [Streptomyces roseoverticillatus]|uniref:2Fe-2S iron-sulfur cluster-binding protein n=1 Tax=Streptomyces roseoverticillatus TaxID=66429 RepID=UPI0006932431|nr:2Fe-2S iron-sulfur cluster-binding protein [Streptomyces roseoverticillatus]
MSDEQRQAHAAGWEPIPRGGEYDEGTTFLQLPPELLAHPGVAMSGTGAWDPLAAAGSGGYVPPSADSWQQAPAASGAHGQWGVPQGPHASQMPHAAQEPHVPQGAHAPQAEVHVGHDGGVHDAHGVREVHDAHGAHDVHGADPQATAEWPMPGDASTGSTGQWSVPAAGDDPVDESGEYLVRGGSAQEPAGAAPAPAPWSAQPVDDSWRQSLAAATPAAGTPIVGGTGQWSVPVVPEDATDTADTSGEYALDGFTGSAAENSASGEPPAVDVTGAFTVPQYVTDVTGTGDVPGGAETAAAAGNAGAAGASEEPEQPVHSMDSVHSMGSMDSVHPVSSEQLPEQVESPAGEPEQQPAQPTQPQQAMHAESFGHAEQTGHTGMTEQAGPPERPGLPTEHPGLPAEQPGLPTPAQEPGHSAEAEPPAQPEQQPAQPTLPEPFVPQQSGPEATDVAAAAGAVAAAATAADGPAHEDPAPPAYAPLGHDALGHDTLGPDPLGAHPLAPHTEHPCASYVLRVNGTDRPVTDAWIGESLLYVLRERLGLAGAKDGCSQGECGACSVQVDGRLVASCLVPAATTAGSEVRTVEGLAADGRPSDVQRALAECGAVQCGFCVPGMAMTMHDLLEGNHAPTELETRQAICGNLCRCSGYRGVLDAVRQVVGEREAAAAHEQELQQGLEQGLEPGLQHGLEQGLQQGLEQGPQDAQQQYEAGQPDADQARIPHQAGPHGGGSGRATA